MSLERDAHAVLHELREQKHDPWGHYAERLAQGIERSGVPGLLDDIAASASEQVEATNRVRASTEDVVRGVAALVAVNAAGFQSVCAELSKQTTHLASIESLLANPLTTAAQERYRRGVHALGQGWADDAAVEFRAAIASDPFAATAHYGLGLALGQQDDHTGATDAFAAAAKYCGTDLNLRPLLASSTLLGAQAADSAGQRERAVELCRVGALQVPDCAELQLALASRTEDAEALQRALSTAPELAIVAVATSIPRAREIAELVAAMPDGPIQQMRRATEDFHQMGGENLPAVPDDVPASLTYHRRWRSEGPQRAQALVAGLRAERGRLEVALSAARASADKPAPPRGNPAKVPVQLMVALVAGGAFVFFATLCWTGFREAFIIDGAGPDGISLNDDDVDKLGGIAKFLGGGFCGYWSAVLAFTSLRSALESKKSNQNRTEARSKFRASQAADVDTVGRIESELRQIDASLAIADAMLDATRSSVPRRTMPLATGS